MKIWRTTVVLLPAILTMLAACHIPFKKSAGIYTVTFNSNGGSSVSDQQMLEGNPIVEPIPPTLSGHIFAGWYSDSSLTEAWDFSSGIVNGDMTLYAKWKNNGAGETSSIDALYVQGGTFQMGSTDSDADEEESPVHPVTVSSFYISRYEVSSRQYLEFLNEVEVSVNADSVLLNDNGVVLLNAYSAHYTYDGTRFLFVETDKGDNLDRPVSYVTWYGAVEYCNWLSGKEGLTKVYTMSKDTVTWNKDANGWRLPTEAEWEFAARGGIESKGYKYSGSNNADEVGWYELNADENNSVTQKTANELGLYNMSGNVSEWCWDWYGDYPSNARINPFGASGIERVIRGGDENSSVSELRSTYRDRAQPNYAASRRGFRPVRWETPPAIYRISFDTNGGSDVPEQVVAGGGYIDEPFVPSIKSGHRFQGWHSDSTLSTPWDFDDDTVDTDMILYAGWETLPPMQTVDVQGGSIQMGSTDSDAYEDESPVHRVTVSSFQMGQYEVTNLQYLEFVNEIGLLSALEMNGNRLISDDLIRAVMNNTWITLITAQPWLYGEDSPANYVTWYGAVEYCNWLSEKDGLTKAYIVSKDTVDWDRTANGWRLPTEAEWEFAARGGIASKGYKYSGSDTADDVGWYDDNSENKIHSVGLKQANELGLFDMSGNVLEWCWDWYGSDYYSYSASDNPTGPDSGTWRVQRSGSKYYAMNHIRSSSRDYYSPDNAISSTGFRLARWETPPVRYAVSFNVDGGSAVASQNVTEESYAAEPTAPTKSSYVFMGWYTDSSFARVWDFDTDEVKENMTLYAKWAVLRTVSFHSNGGSAVPIQRVGDGAHVAEPVSPRRDGHTFMGWYIDSGLTSIWDFDTYEVNEDKTLYARWEVIIRTVSFNTNGGSAVQEQEVAEGGHAVEPTPPMRSGHAFMDWHSDNGLSDAWDFASGVVNGDMTLYARWVIAHTVTFDSNSGSTVQKQEVAEGGHAAEPLPPTRSGYAFMGWYSDSGLTDAWDFGSDTVDSDMTLYARWSGTVSFNPNGGSAVPQQVIGEGDHASEPPPPMRSGYAFMGWYTDSGLTNAWNFGSDTVNGNMTLYAKWSGTVSFASNGGSTVQEQEVAEGNHASEPPPPTRSGYAFMGWYTDSGLSNAWDFDSDTVNGNMTLYAKWGGTVSFASNSGSAVQEQEVAEGSHAVEPSPPTRSGYTFMGWYSNSGLTNAWDFGSDTVNGDMTLYARWGGTVSFASNDGSAVLQQVIGEGSHASEPPPPMRSGYAFMGWYTDSGLTNAWNFDSDTVNGDMTLYAKWGGTVSFASNGGNAVQEQEVAEGDHAAEPPPPTRSGYTFMGWYTDSGLSNAWDFDSDTVNGDMTLYVKWGGTVIFNSNGGSAVQEQEVAEGSHAAEPSAPTKSGYVFMGWYSNSGLSEAWNFDSDMVDGDMTLYAKWAIARTVSFNVNGGSAVPQQVIGEGSHAAEPSAPSKSGHIFMGWYTDSGLTNAWNFDSDTVNGDMTLYAKWEVIHYTVSFNTNGGNGVSNQGVADGGHAVEPSPPTRSGYAFDGWYSDSSLTNAWDFGSDTVNSNITLYAKWVITHTVTFNSNSGSTVTSQQVAEGASVTEPAVPTRSGYAFGGWYSDIGLSTAWTFGSNTVDRDITLYAKWVIVYHTITFNSNSGSAVTSQQVAEGTYAVEPAAPTRSGHAFGGWYTDSGLSNVWTFGSDTVNSDITLYAKWVIVYHTVTFNSNGGSAVTSQQVAEGTYAAQPAAPTRSGYAFDGWYSDSGLSNAWTFGSDTVNSDITLYAKWVPLHTVTFNSNSGSAVTSQQVAEGAYAAEPSPPIRSGYTFMDWYSDSGLTNAWDFVSDTVNGDMTLYAKWGYTVSFSTNGGSAVPSQEVALGSLITEPIPPTRSGGVFLEWYSKKLTDGWNFNSNTVDGDMTLYARWSNYLIGDIGPAEGIVFYDKGSYSDGWRYLEAAPSDQGYVEWGGDGTVLGGTGTVIGSGKSNTENIVNKLGLGNYAARLCYDLELGGYDDWFLPSLDELYKLSEQKDTVGGFVVAPWDWYWSSSEDNFEYAVLQSFYSGRRGGRGSKNGDLHVRAVRAF